MYEETSSVDVVSHDLAPIDTPRDHVEIAIRKGRSKHASHDFA